MDWFKVQKIRFHRYSVTCTVTRIEIELSFALSEAVIEIRAEFQNCHIRDKLGIGKVRTHQRCTYTLFLPYSVKGELVFNYGQRLPRYGPIFKIVIFGHEI